MPNPAATPLVSRAYEKTGHFASREGISRDAGHMGRNTGCPGKYGTVGNPICCKCTLNGRSGGGVRSVPENTPTPNRCPFSIVADSV